MQSRGFVHSSFFFFFQAEDGIRDADVTGVQTCALPISFQKGVRALEIGRPGWVVGGSLADDRLTSDTPEDLRVALRTPTPERVFQIKRALLAGVSVDEVAQASGIDPWFLFQMEELLEAERWFAALPP